MHPVFRTAATPITSIADRTAKGIFPRSARPTQDVPATTSNAAQEVSAQEEVPTAQEEGSITKDEHGDHVVG